MNCKNCGETLEEDSRFCGKCGSPVVEKKLCAACEKPVESGLQYCIYCGFVQDGSTLCPSCKGAIPKDNEFCIKCGYRTDGKVECLNCGTLISEGNFCGRCGMQVRAGDAIGAQSASRRDGKSDSRSDTQGGEKKKYIRGGVIKDSKAYNLAKTWAITGILLLSLILSLFAFSNVKMDFRVDGTWVEVEIKSNPFVAVTALWGFTADEGDYEKMQEELGREVTEELKRKYARFEDEEIGDIKISVDYNYLKMMAAEAKGLGSVVDDYPDPFRDADADIGQIIMVVVQSTVPLMLIIATLVMFILSLIRSIATIIKGERANDKKDMSAIAWVLGLLTLLKLVGNVSVSALGVRSSVDVKTVLNGAAIAILVICVIAFVCLVAMHYVFTDAKIDIFGLVSQGVSIMFLIVFFLTLTANSFKVVDADAKFGVSSFWKALLIEKEGGISAQIMNTLAVINYLAILVIVIICLYKLLCGAVKPRIISNIKFGAALAILSVVFVAITIVGMNILNDDEKILKFSALFFVPLVVSIISVIQSIVLHIVDKNYKSKSLIALR